MALNSGLFAHISCPILNASTNHGKGNTSPDALHPVKSLDPDIIFQFRTVQDFTAQSVGLDR